MMSNPATAACLCHDEQPRHRRLLVLYPQGYQHQQHSGWQSTYTSGRSRYQHYSGGFGAGGGFHSSGGGAYEDVDKLLPSKTQTLSSGNFQATVFYTSKPYMIMVGRRDVMGHTGVGDIGDGLFTCVGEGGAICQCGGYALRCNQAAYGCSTPAFSDPPPASCLLPSASCLLPSQLLPCQRLPPLRAPIKRCAKPRNVLQDSSLTH
eukprot:353120-Chlamydomonas_euryale.AAC.12